MKKIVVPVKESYFQRLLKKHNKGLNLAITTIVTSFFILFINLAQSNPEEYQQTGLFRFFMYCLFIIQLLSLYGIIIAVIQLIKHKSLQFTKKQMRKIIIGFTINFIWLSGFVTLIVSVIRSL